MEYASVTLNISKPCYVQGAGIYDVGSFTCPDGTKLDLFMNLPYWRPAGYLLVGALPEKTSGFTIGNYRFHLKPICPSLWLLQGERKLDLENLDDELRLGHLNPVVHFKRKYARA